MSLFELNRLYGGDRFTLLIGIIRYANDYHSGQWSRLYGIMSRLHSKFHRIAESDWYMRGPDNVAARMIYRTLKRAGVE